MEICVKEVSFIEKNSNFKVPKKDKFSEDDLNILNKFKHNYEKIISYIDNQDVNSYVNFIVENLFAANKYFNDQEPWKKKSDLKRLNTINYVSLELIRKMSILLYPIIPNSALKSLNIFGIKENEIDFNTLVDNESLIPNSKLLKINILFKKVEKND